MPEPLALHLRRVSGKAELFAREMRPDDAEWQEEARHAGLLHDLGKYRPQFQSYLAGLLNEAPHAVVGATVARPFLGDPGTFAVAGHHAGLHDAAALKSALREWPEEDLVRIRAAAEADRILPVNPVENRPRFGDRLAEEFRTRMLFSLLVDADRLMSEMHDTGRERAVSVLDPGSRLEALLARTRELAARPVPGGSERCVQECRDRILAACLAHANDEPGLFSLTVPTGGGKTLAGMAFALAHSQRYQLRRVVVVIPYLSIIEQSAEVYESVFGPGVVLEHHSAVEPAPLPGENREDPHDAAAENWDAPIIVTTTVQLVNTLFASHPSRARRLHRLARSVLLLDEVQTLPVHLLNPLVQVLGELARGWGASIVMSSATQPGFHRSSGLPSGFEPASVREIAPQPTELARRLRRVTYEIDPIEQVTTREALADEIVRHPQVLCVVNLRRQAADLWRAVQKRLPVSEQEGLFHLSSLMCAQHRLDRLGTTDEPAVGTIRRRLRAGLPCRVVSTQVVEAGVDLDFPRVLRALAPLEAIVQAAGRCNREGRLTDERGKPVLGQVRVFRPEEGGPRGWYRVATEATAGWLDTMSPDELAIQPDLFARYFGSLWQYVPTDRARHGIERPLQEVRKSFNFREVESRAKVIDADTVPITVPWGDSVMLLERIRAARFATRDDLRRLQRFLVNVQRHTDLKRLMHDGQVDQLVPDLDLLWLVRPESYCPHRGLRLELPPEAFVL